jgi:DNA-directed RNA polymerase beta subunit
VEFEFDLNNALFVRIDKKRKLPATTILRAMGIESDAEILSLFYDTETLTLAENNRKMWWGKLSRAIAWTPRPAKWSWKPTKKSPGKCFSVSRTERCVPSTY